MKPTVDLVVASFNENLGWLKWVPSDWRVFVYNANSARTDFPEGVNPIRVPNGGREAGQYIQHLVQQYGDHSDYTLFVQGMPFDHNPNAIVRLFLGEPFGPGPVQYVGTVPPMKSGFAPAPQGDVERALRFAYGPDARISPMVPFQVGAQFYVKRDVITARPKEFYENLLVAAYDTRWLSFGHMMEANWGCVFDWERFV